MGKFDSKMNKSNFKYCSECGTENELGSKDGFNIEAFDGEGEDIEDMVLLALENSGLEAIKIPVAPFDKPLYNYLALNCEHYDLGHAEQFTILCFENVIR